MREPKVIQVPCQDGTEKSYILHKIPAIPCREIVAKYPISAMPKLGDYAVNEETMLKLMAYVGVDLGNGNTQLLTTRALVDNHVPDWEALARIEIEMLGYNTSFFKNGKASTFLEGITRNLQQSISKILTGLLEQSLQKDKQP